MKRFLIAITLACVLSATALAGDMPTVGAPAPAPNGAVAGEIPTVDRAGDMPTIDSAAPFSETQSSAANSVLLAILRLIVQ
jgi:hypothetical protein